MWVAGFGQKTLAQIGVSVFLPSFPKKKQKNKMKKYIEEQTPFGAPKGGAQKGGASQKGWGSQRVWGLKFRAFFFPLPPPFSLFLCLSWVSSRRILVVFSKAGTLKCARLEFSWLLCETPAALKKKAQFWAVRWRGPATGGLGKSKPTTTTTTITQQRQTQNKWGPKGRAPKGRPTLPRFGVWVFGFRKFGKTETLQLPKSVWPKSSMTAQTSCCVEGAPPG